MMDSPLFTLVQIVEVRESAEERLVGIYSDFFREINPPELSNGLVRTILEEAIRLNVVKIQTKPQ